MLARQDIAKIIDLPAEENTATATLDAVKHAITVHDITYVASKNNEEIFTNISGKFLANTCTSVNSHKPIYCSTLFMLLLNCLQPISGKISYDKQDVRTIAVNNLRAVVSYISADTTLFTGSLLENITLFREEKIEQARIIIVELELDKLFSILPDGYNTHVDNSTSAKIPQNLKQRIGMARMLLEEPNVILYDHADNGIDHATETIFINVLTKLKPQCTIILASDNAAILNLADKHFVLHRDKLSEM